MFKKLCCKNFTMKFDLILTPKSHPRDLTLRYGVFVINGYVMI